jgi:hypothetical protein
MTGLSGVLQVGIDILNTVLGSSPQSPTGTILAQTGDVVKEYADANKSEWWQHVGLASRPSNPLAGKRAAQALVFRGPDIDFAFASRDTRTNGIYGNLAPGETCIFAAGADGNAQARSIHKADGSVTLYTTDDNTPTGNAVYLRIHPTKGLCFVAPWGTLYFDQAGFRIQHKAGFEVASGGAGLPGPGSALGSYFRVKAAIVQMQGSQTLLGVGSFYSPVIWGTDAAVLLPTGVIGILGPLGIFASNSCRAGI